MWRISILFVFGLCVGTAHAQDGAAVYKTHCASCHDAPVGRVPPVSALKAMSVPQVLDALESGPMKTVGDTLTANERYAVTIFLARPAAKPAPTPPGAFCSTSAMSSPGDTSVQWSGWSPSNTNVRFQDAETAGLTVDDVPKLKLKWAFGLGDQTDSHSEPAVAGGSIFFGSQDGTVYSLDAKNGCIRWTFKADAGVRSAVTVGSSGRGNTLAVYFGDMHGNAYAVSAVSGKSLWKIKADEHFAAQITAAPMLARGVLYFPVSSFEEALPPLPTYQCCTFRGSVVAINAKSGKQVWKTYTISNPPQETTKNKSGVQMWGPSGAAVWSTPTFDEKRDVVYVATGDNYSDPATQTSDAVLAIDAKTGQILWSQQLTAGDTYNNACGAPGGANCPKSRGPDFDFGQPPILVSLANGRRVLAIGQKSGMAYGLDPDSQGEVIWHTRVSKGGVLGGTEWGSASDGQNMYVAVSDLKIAGAVPDKTSPQGYRLQLDSHQGGGLVALRLSSGEQVWNAKPSSACGDRAGCSPAQSQAVSAIPGVVFSGSLDGHIRAYSAAAGEILWDVDTAHDYQTINGQTAHGGSLDGPGPVIAGGIVYVSSGYAEFGGMPGNVLLAFSVDGK